jgi:DNA-binding Xre family transcriptional regulator
MAKLRNNLRVMLTQKYGGTLPPQEKLAEDIGLSQTTISRWLSEKIDRFDAPVLEKFCTFLECNVGDLVYLEGLPHEQRR